MDKIEKICQEIARLKGQLIRGACAAQIEMETNCKDEAYNEVLAFLDTLSEEPDKDLEEAARDAICMAFGCDPAYYGNKAEFSVTELYQLFIAGAKWQAEKDKDTIELAEDHAYFAGAKWQKQQMMKEAVEGKVFMSFAQGHNQMVMVDVDLPTNTKVKVIVIPED